MHMLLEMLLHGIFAYLGERGKEKVEEWALKQEPASTWWSIGRGTCMEVVRNRETHAGRSAAVKMIQPYVCSSLLPRLLASLSNRLGGTAPPTAQEKPCPRLLNATTPSV